MVLVLSNWKLDNSVLKLAKNTTLNNAIPTRPNKDIIFSFLSVLKQKSKQNIIIDIRIKPSSLIQNIDARNAYFGDSFKIS